ncbi:hypothetical protein IKQ21_08085 [bacterium]|nr:hypothetical protein [bacterium]
MVMKSVNNLNNCFYESLDTNFEKAYSMSEQNYSHHEIVDMLKNGNITQKQIAALRLDCVYDENEANIILSNLTGCDGKIREAVAYTINKILIDHPDVKTFFYKSAAEIFAASTIDINANICRYTVDNAVLLMDCDDFSNKYISQIIKYIEESLSQIDKFIFKDKKYVINKQIFKLYWCLESLIYFYKFVDSDVLKTILERVITQKEYTVREKAAEIALKSNCYPEIIKLLENDENYYVRAVFKRQTDQD